MRLILATHQARNLLFHTIRGTRESSHGTHSLDATERATIRPILPNVQDQVLEASPSDSLQLAEQ
jgi:hypothetical protein